MATKFSRPRGRPRRFDPEQAVATAQRLFHARGYDAVSIADLTRALGINPPSFYAAFGSKSGLYARVLCRYGGTGAIPLEESLRPDPAPAGCLGLEGIHCNDREAREAPRAANVAAEDVIRRYIAARHPEEAERLTDFVCTTMTGLSAKARNGHSLDRLLATARLAGLVLAQALRA